MPATVRVLINPRAGSVAEADLTAVRAATGVEVVEVDSAEATRAAATEAARDGIETVVAAGGDGTLHLVVNGLMDAGDDANSRPALGVLPLGTGNDFARTLGIPLGDVPACVACVADGPRHRIDLIRYEHSGAGGSGYAVNVCAGGFAGTVGEVLTDELKATWGPFAYLVGAASLVPDITDYHTEVSWDDGPPERLDAFNVVVANGRTAAGGRPVAPRASPEDGLLDVVIVRTGGALDVARLAARVVAGDYLADDQIVFRRAGRVRIESQPGMWFNVDGELRANEPVAFEVVPGALRVVVGPDYRATVAEP